MLRSTCDIYYPTKCSICNNAILGKKMHFHLMNLNIRTLIKTSMTPENETVEQKHLKKLKWRRCFHLEANKNNFTRIAALCLCRAAQQTG